MKYLGFLSIVISVLSILLVCVLLFSCDSRSNGNTRWETEISLDRLIHRYGISEMIRIDICTPDDSDINEWTIYHTFTSEKDIDTILSAIKESKKNQGILSGEKIRFHFSHNPGLVIDWTPDHDRKIIYFDGAESYQLYRFFILKGIIKDKVL